MTLPSWYVFPKPPYSRRVKFMGRVFLMMIVAFGCFTWFVRHLEAPVRSSSEISSLVPPRPTQMVMLHGKPFWIEIADTDVEREKGLSDRLSLPVGHGMLFMFDQPVRHPFWMQRMHFPLDIVFIRNGVIVDLVENLTAPQRDELPARYQPTVDYDQVFEINVGMIDILDLKIGSPLVIPTENERG